MTGDYGLDCVIEDEVITGDIIEASVFVVDILDPNSHIDTREKPGKDLLLQIDDGEIIENTYIPISTGTHTLTAYITNSEGVFPHPYFSPMDTLSAKVGNGVTDIGVSGMTTWFGHSSGGYYPRLTEMVLPETLKLFPLDFADAWEAVGEYFENSPLYDVTTLSSGVKIVTFDDWVIWWGATEYPMETIDTIEFPASATKLMINVPYGLSNSYTDIVLPEELKYLVKAGDNDMLRLTATTIALPDTLEYIYNYDIYGHIISHTHFTSVEFTSNTPPDIDPEPATIANIFDTDMYIVPVGASAAYIAAGYSPVYEKGHVPEDISLTFVSGSIDAETGEEIADSTGNIERSALTSTVAEEWYKIKAANTSQWTYQVMFCCYDKVTGIYAGAYTGSGVEKAEHWLSTGWKDIIMDTTVYDYDVRAVARGSYGPPSPDVKVNGIPV